MVVSDPTATAVGDLLTVVVKQSSTATKNQKRNTSKKSNVDARIESFLFSPTGSSAFTKGAVSRHSRHRPRTTSRVGDRSRMSLSLQTGSQSG